MNRISRFRWWWLSAWSATMAAFDRRSAPGRIVARYKGRGPAPDLSRMPTPPWLQPDDEIGVAAGLRAVLISDERHSLALVDCIGYSNGFEFTISYRSREAADRIPIAFNPPLVSDRDLSVGIEFPDGLSASAQGSGMEAIRAYYEAAAEGKAPPLPPGPLVMPHGGGAGGKRADMRYWCWPLPPDSPIKITVAWGAVGISPTTVTLDASSIRRAGLSSTRLWSG